jgi:hypothetical protein
MRIRRSLSILLLTCLLGVVALPAAPVAAQNCATIGPGANLAGCNLSGLDLSGVNLAGANLRGANLEGANLDGANLSGANLSNARVTEGALDNANTSGANLRGIRWVPAPVPTNPPVIVPVVTLSYTPTGSSNHCNVQVGLTGFAPDTTYTVLFTYVGIGPKPELTRTITTGADGTAFDTLFSWAFGAVFEAEVDGVKSSVLQVAC